MTEEDVFLVRRKRQRRLSLYLREGNAVGVEQFRQEGIWRAVAVDGAADLALSGKIAAVWPRAQENSCNAFSFLRCVFNTLTYLLRGTALISFRKHFYSSYHFCDLLQHFTLNYFGSWREFLYISSYRCQNRKTVL